MSSYSTQAAVEMADAEILRDYFSNREKQTPLLLASHQIDAENTAPVCKAVHVCFANTSVLFSLLSC